MIPTMIPTWWVWLAALGGVVLGMMLMAWLWSMEMKKEEVRNIHRRLDEP